MAATASWRPAAWRPPLEGVAAELIAKMRDAACSVVAVDVPSGLHGDTGVVMGCAPSAELTVTFFRAKPGHYSLEGLRRCGELTIVDIGIPSSVLQTIRPSVWRNEPALWRPPRPRRARPQNSPRPPPDPGGATTTRA